MTIWQHTRKGRIVGTITWSDATWTDIRLAEEAWADARHQRLDPPGTVARYRTEFLTEVTA